MDGSLICCDGCPAAFHARCVGVSRDKLPEGEWHCPECLIGDVDRPVKDQRPLQGAELLGLDADGRLYFGSCGYLLVSDYYGADVSYYNKHDIPAVLYSLMNSSHIQYMDIVKAISSHWGFHCDLSGHARQVDNKVYGGTGLKPELNSPNSLSLKRKKATCVEKKSPVTCFENSVEDHLVNADKKLPHTSNADSSQDFKSLAVKSNYIDSQEEFKACFEHDAVDLATNQRHCIDSQVLSGQDDYINYYSFGRVVSSVAQDLIGKSLEGTNRGFIASIDDIKSSQMKTILDTVNKLGWSVVQKLSLGLVKESCGWCFCCKNLGDQECLFNSIENKLLDGSKNLPVGIYSAKIKGSHFLHAVHQLLSIEDDMNGLLAGPWENPFYRKHWNKCVRKASDTESLKKYTLSLESSLRRIAISADWLRSTDSDLTVGSSSLVLTSHIDGSSKEGGGKKRGRKSKCEAKRSSVDANALLSYAGNTSGIYWWRGGRLSRQLFHWRMLPRSLATKTARQAGCQKIPGVFYPDGIEFGKRSRYLAWRAAVEMSKSVAELFCHIKELDKNIKWKDLKNIPSSAVDLKKQPRSLKNVTVQRKIVEGSQVNYVVDFGRKKTIPENITKHAVMNQETSSGRKKYWLNESNVPLRLLKAYEVKRLNQIASNCKLGKTLPITEVNNHKLTKPIRQRGFSYLFSRHQKLDCHRCGDCNEVVLISDAVSCHFCNGIFHKNHFRVPKGVATVIYACSACNDKITTTNVKSKKSKIQAGGGKRSKSRRKSKLIAERSDNVSTTKQEVQPENNRRNASQTHKRKEVGKVETSFKRQKIATEVNAEGTALKLRHSSRRIAAKSKYLRNNSIKKFKLMKRSHKHVNNIKEARKSKVNKVKAVRKTMHQSALKLEDAISGIRWCTGKRTTAYHSYWLNGLLWARKQDGEQGLCFRSTKVLMPSSMLNGLISRPVCFLCNEEYRPDLIFIGCEKCGDWFHAAAFSVTLENISNLTGFRCHKCRLKTGPVCPYIRDGRVTDLQELKHCPEERASTGSSYHRKRAQLVNGTMHTIRQSDFDVVHFTRNSARAKEKMATPSMTVSLLPGNCSKCGLDKYRTSDAGQENSDTFSLPDDGKLANIGIAKDDFKKSVNAIVCSRNIICQEQTNATSCGERSLVENNTDVYDSFSPSFERGRREYLECNKQSSESMMIQQFVPQTL